MCGIAGLSVGCAAVSYCPRKVLGQSLAAVPENEQAAERDYRSPFTKWDDRAIVRTAPRRVLADGDTGLMFSPDLVPLAQHPLVAALRPELLQCVLAQHLYRYLDFTTKLEHVVVNRTALGIAYRTIDVGQSEEMQFDAYKVYCDEAYHALVAQDLLRQAAARTGIVPRLPKLPYFLLRLQEIQEGLAPELRDLAELLFVIVSETLISGTLADIPNDAQVATVVSEVIRDHAADEGRHHAYFAAFLRILWGRLDLAQRRVAGLLIPDLIYAFLLPDKRAAREELCGYGLSADAVEQVLAESWSSEIVSRSVAVSAARTVRYFRDVGVLDDQQVAESFSLAGLVDVDERKAEDLWHR